MTTTEQPGQDKGVRSFVKAIWHHVTYWGVRVGFAGGVIIVVLAHPHFIEEPHYVLLVILGLIVSFLVPNLRLQTKRGFSRFVGE
jgi:hypothetical protein